MGDLRSRAPDVQLSDCVVEDDAGAQDSLPFTFPKTPENEGDMGLYHHHPHHHPAPMPLAAPVGGPVGPGVGMQVPMPIPPGMEFLAVHLQHIHGSISALQQQFCCLLSEQTAQRMQIQELQAQQEQQQQTQQQALAQQRLRERRRVQLRLLQGPSCPLEAALSDCDLASSPGEEDGAAAAADGQLGGLEPPRLRTRSAPPVLRSGFRGLLETHQEVLSPAFVPRPAARAAAKEKKKKAHAQESKNSTSEDSAAATEEAAATAAATTALESRFEELASTAAADLQKFEMRLSDVAESVGCYNRRLEVAEDQLAALSVTCQQFRNALTSSTSSAAEASSSQEVSVGEGSSRSSTSPKQTVAAAASPEVLERSDSKSSKASAKSKGQASTASTAQAKAAAKAAAAAAKATASALGKSGGGSGGNGSSTNITSSSNGNSRSTSKNLAGSSSKDSKLSSKQESKLDVAKSVLTGLWELVSNNPAFGAILALLAVCTTILMLRMSQLSTSQYIESFVDDSRTTAWVSAASLQQVYANLGLAPTSVVGTSKSTETVVATDRSTPLGAPFGTSSSSSSISSAAASGPYGLTPLSITATKPVTLPRNCDGLDGSICAISRTTAASSHVANHNGSVPPSVAVKAKDSSAQDIATKGAGEPLPALAVDFTKKVGLASPFQLDHLRRSALHLSAAEGRSDVVRALLACSDFAEVNAKDLQGNTALHLAAHQGHHKVVAELLKSPRFTKASEPNLADKTALHMAVSSPHLQTHGTEVVLQLLKALPPSAVNQQDHGGRTILHLTVLSSQHELLEAILSSSKFTAAKAKDNRGMTALHIAASKGMLSVVRSLLRIRFNHDAATVLGVADAKDDDGQTAMDVADGKNKYEVMNVIVNSVTEARLKVQAAVPTKRILGDLPPLTVPSSPGS